MAGLCTSSTRDNGAGCGHRTIVGTLDGEAFTDRLTQAEIDAEPWTATEKLKLRRLCYKLLRVRGLTFDKLANRVIIGEEATNVKTYTFFGPGAAITKTNIGTSYVNICPGLNGERIPVDFTGCTQFRFFFGANLVGTGQFGARCVRDGDSEILIEQANLGAAGERDLDSDWTNLPAAFLGQGITLMRVQAKSQTGADDPVFRRCQLGLR